jgi:hypothetical protein
MTRVLPLAVTVAALVGACEVATVSRPADRRIETEEDFVYCRNEEFSLQPLQRCQCIDDCAGPEGDGIAVCQSEAEGIAGSGSANPGGGCLLGCTDDDDCVAGSVCLPSQLCAVTCESDVDCDAGRICGVVSSGAPPVCFPFCQADDECESGICNVARGRCVDAVPVDLAPVGGPCAGDEECTSNFCGDGVCRALCSVSAQVCGEGFRCVDIGAEDLGLCRPVCRGDGDCADVPGSTGCSDPGDGGGDVCEFPGDR